LPKTLYKFHLKLKKPTSQRLRVLWTNFIRNWRKLREAISICRTYSLTNNKRNL